MAEDTSFWRGRRVLVTGCTGFLSGAVGRELLARGAEVVGLVHERPATDLFGPHNDGRVHLVRGRVDNVFRLHSAMAVHAVAAVFHLESPDSGAPDRGTAAVLQAMKLYSHRVPVVTARAVPQLALARPEDHREERLGVVRFGEVFGPGDPKLLTGERLVLPADGPARDFVFVRDAARACLSAAEAGPGDYPFRSGWVMTERQMAATMRDADSGRPIEAPDSAPVANPLGWRPKQTLGEAINETRAWYREFLRTGAGASLRAAA